MHILLHLVEADAPVPSEKLALAMQTNAVVVRRVMAGLRDAGLVRSEKGHGGGWSLGLDPAQVSLRNVCVALGSPEPFAMGHRSESPTCLVEQAVNTALDETFREAEALLLARMGSITLVALADDFRARLAASGGATSIEDAAGTRARVCRPTPGQRSRPGGGTTMARHNAHLAMLLK